MAYSRIRAENIQDEPGALVVPERIVQKRKIIPQWCGLCPKNIRAPSGQNWDGMGNKMSGNRLCPTV